MNCPNCKSDNFSKNSSFSTETEPIAGAASSMVIIDMMYCNGCNLEFPAVRGRKKYILVPKTRITTMSQKQTELQNKSTEIQGLIQQEERRQVEILEDIERLNLRTEISNLETRIGLAREQTDNLDRRRNALKAAITLMAPTSNRSPLGGHILS